MRLEPVDTPKNLMVKMAYKMMQKQFGKVLTPLKVIYARKPSLMLTAQVIDKTSNKLSFDPSFRLLVQTFISMTNGCAFCRDFRQTLSIKRHIGQEKFSALDNYRTSELFNERERAALSYIEEVIKNKHVAEDTFMTLKKHFTDTEIIELTWINAAENYYNYLMIPLEIESDGLCQLTQEYH